MPVPFSALNNRLEAAFQRGDLDECRLLLAAGAEFPAEPCKRAKLLLSAIYASTDQKKLLEFLLQKGFDPNSVRDDLGEDYQKTPFTAAAGIARLDLMEILVAAGADIHWRGPSGANAASEAFPSRAWQAPREDTPERAAVCRWLAEHGVRIDPRAANSRRMLLWAAAQPGSWSDIPVLLALGVASASLKWTPLMHRIASGEATAADCRAMPPEELEHRDYRLRTPFLLAVSAGRQDLADALIGRGADFRASGWCGTSALHFAAEYGLPDMVEYLVHLGFSVEHPDEFDHPPLRCVGSADAARKLLELGADVNAAGRKDSKAIHNTLPGRALWEVLLDAGADVNETSGINSPLINACKAGDAGLVAWLLARGALPDLTSNGRTALFAAVRADAPACVRLLLEAGANINAQGYDDGTCLWNVQSLPMARLLLNHGADPSIASLDGEFAETSILPTSVSALFKEHRLRRQAG